MTSIVVGGTRGIGYALASQLLSKKLMGRVVVTGRTKPASLAEGMVFVPMDLSASEEQLVAACEAVKQHAGETSEALFFLAASDAAGGKWNKTSASDMMRSFAVSVVGPMVVTQQLVPSLEKGAGKLLVSVSASYGSIAANTTGGAAAYRCSKAALNMWNKSLSVELPSIKTLLYHPGVVQTDLLASAFYGGKTAQELLASNKGFARLKTPEAAAAELIAVCMGPDVKSGHFYDFAVKELPW